MYFTCLNLLFLIDLNVCSWAMFDQKSIPGLQGVPHGLVLGAQLHTISIRTPYVWHMQMSWWTLSLICRWYACSCRYTMTVIIISARKKLSQDQELLCRGFHENSCTISYNKRLDYSNSLHSGFTSRVTFNVYKPVNIIQLSCEVVELYSYLLIRSLFLFLPLWMSHV